MTAPGPRRLPLDRDRIIAGLLELGVDRFSMHSLARHLGVSATALYRYFPSREALLAGTMDVFCERLTLPALETPWPEYLRELARAFRRALLEMPGAADYGTAIGPATPSAFAIIEAALGRLTAAGFDPSQAWRVYGQVVNHAFQSVQSEERFHRMVAEHGDLGYRVYKLSEEERETYPELARAVDAMVVDFDRAFETTLEWLVAGIEASARRDQPARR